MQIFDFLTLVLELPHLGFVMELIWLKLCSSTLYRSLKPVQVASRASIAFSVVGRTHDYCGFAKGADFGGFSDQWRCSKTGRREESCTGETTSVRCLGLLDFREHCSSAHKEKLALIGCMKRQAEQGDCIWMYLQGVVMCSRQQHFTRKLEAQVEGIDSQLIPGCLFALQLGQRPGSCSRSTELII